MGRGNNKRAVAFSVLIAFFLMAGSNVSAEIYSSISGRVIAEDTGQGMEGVSVVLLGLGSEVERHDTITKEDGLYVLENLKPGDYLLGFGKDDIPYIQEMPNIFVTVPMGKNLVNVNYVFKVGGGVSGTVYDADGTTPLDRITVSVIVPDQPDDIDAADAELTDSNGKYLLLGLPESDKAVVTVRVRGHAKLTREVTIRKGETTPNVNFVVKWDDITGISGHVKSSIDGSPIKNAEVVLWDASEKRAGYAYTDEAGNYSILGLPPGSYQAAAFWPGGGGWVREMDILIESGKTTEVNFEFDMPAPTSRSEEGILGLLAALSGDTVLVSGVKEAGPGIRPAGKISVEP
ncbi:MAG: carboxypeptidase-like regulatory domain-containing protein [Thermodesulfobacteriota bacterium]